MTKIHHWTNPSLMPNMVTAPLKSLKGKFRIVSEYDLTIRFEFDHNLQRMSVIVRDPFTSKCFVFTKGSTEAVSGCCNSK